MLINHPTGDFLSGDTWGHSPFSLLITSKKTNCWVLVAVIGGKPSIAPIPIPGIVPKRVSLKVQDGPNVRWT